MLSLRKRKELAFAVDDSTLGQIIGRQLHSHLIAGDDANEVFSHSAGDVRHDLRSGF